MTAPQRHRVLHHGCDCDSCVRIRGRVFAKRTPHEDDLHVLYRFFDRAGHLLYVGVSNNPVIRMRTHQKTSIWFTDAALATFEHFPDRASLMDAECEAIQTEHPRHNSVYADGRELLPRTAPRQRSSPRRPKITPAELQQLVLDLGLPPY